MQSRPTLTRLLLIPAIVLAALCGHTAVVRAGTLTEAESLFASGQYETCRREAAAAVQQGVWNVRWPMLLIRCQLTAGQYADALTTYEAAAKRFTFNALPLQLLGVEVLRMNDATDRADRLLVAVRENVRQAMSRFMSKDSMVAVGRYLVTQNEDGRQILERFYDAVIATDPKFVDAYVASAELALQKNNFALAAQTLETAVRLQPENANLYYLQALAFMSSDPLRANEAIEEALRRNKRHAPTLLLMAERAIDGERYDEANQSIQKILQTNVHHPEAWALLAVIAHLEGKPEIEKLMRAAALGTWSQNPDVDHLIGKKLSQKYRFAEGAAYQRSALAMRPTDVTIRFQLAQDLLHLGNDEAGWKLAEQAQQDDPYNVVAYNLMTLHDSLESFRTVSADGIVLRMERHEADVYGREAMQLLQTAKRILCEKYDVKLEREIIVEIFPQQSDFAIRTFGLPGGAGYLGVCFGRVVTANSPASQGTTPANWQSVLWHEFCHVVTLEKTRNRMPRWLSEGLSVYEERQRDPRWGQQMTPVFRNMILGEDLTPVSQLSSAFLTPKSAMHVQFAYFESSLAVEYFLQEYGSDAMQRLLVDLGAGAPINDALQRHAGTLAELDAGFAEFAKAKAGAFGKDVDWAIIELEGRPTSEQLRSLLEESPNHYGALKALAKAAIGNSEFDQAEEYLDRLDTLLPDDPSPGCATELRAVLAAKRSDTATERKMLQRLAGLRDDDLATYRRLAELAAADEDWEVVRSTAEAMLAVQPLLPTGHEWLARAGENLQLPADTDRALAVLAVMDPVDPAGLHYRWANALQQLDRSEDAKRKILVALEFAPRYREAYRLLTKLTKPKPVASEAVESEIQSAPTEKEAVEP